MLRHLFSNERERLRSCRQPRPTVTAFPLSKMPEPCVRRKPCQARNSPLFGESSCLARVCPFAKFRRVFANIFIPPGEASPHEPTVTLLCKGQ